MTNWELFEKECRTYLKEKFHLKDEDIVLKGGSDSTSADIKIKIKSGDWINIEAKMPDAQAGQFVVLPRNGKFIFSPRNKSNEEWAADIISYLNENYDKFKNLSTTGDDLEMGISNLSNWIKDYYGKGKKTRFFITSYKDKMVIFPTDKLDEYFGIRACLRIKKSGSGDPSKNNIHELIEVLGVKENYFINKGKKWFVNFSNPNSEKFILKGPSYSYQFSKIDDGSYNIRRLGKTNNANVIFRLNSKKEQDLKDLEIFRKAILE